MSLRLTGLLAAVAIFCSPLVQAVAAERKAGDVFRDCGDCPEMVVIAAGAFTMGSPASEMGREADESPQFTVTIPADFAVGEYEVTAGEYARFVKASAYKSDNKDCTINEPAEAADSYPAVCVNWNDAQAYVKWLSQKTGATYRLLSEAEWEYAARAGTTGSFSFGEDDSKLCEFANGADQTAFKAANLPKEGTFDGCTDGYEGTAPVGSLKPNGFGLYDMHGNVWEWTEDCYHDSYKGAPTDGIPWTSGLCDYRVDRGGGWSMPAGGLRSANRDSYGPARRGIVLGFRVARTF